MSSCDMRVSMTLSMTMTQIKHSSSKVREEREIETGCRAMQHLVLRLWIYFVHSDNLSWLLAPVALLCRGQGGGSIFVAFNAHHHNYVVHLPGLPENQYWSRVVDTNLPPPKDFTVGGNRGVEHDYTITAYSSILLLSKARWKEWTLGRKDRSFLSGSLSWEGKRNSERHILSGLCARNISAPMCPHFARSLKVEHCACCPLNPG